MKKNVLKVFIGLFMLIVTIMLPNLVKAETIDLENATSTGHTVTVGEVDMPVYSVDITWGDMSYDWKYDESVNDYGFKAKLGCEANVWSQYDTQLPLLKEKGELYTDDNCSNVQTNELVDGSTYYTKSRVGGKISVIDNSINGSVNAIVEFNTSQTYSWVVGKFAESYALEIGTGKVEYVNEITDGYLIEQSGLEIRKLDAYLYLENDPAKEITTPITGDIIGTVTINIEEK